MDVETVLAALVLNLLVLMFLRLFENRSIQIVVHSCTSFGMDDGESDEEEEEEEAKSDSVDSADSVGFTDPADAGSVEHKADPTELETERKVDAL